MARAGIHRNERSAHNALMVQNRVARCEQRIALALEGEDAHLALLLERSVDLLIAHTELLMLAVAIRVTHRTLDDGLYLLLLQILEQNARLTHLRIHTGLDDGLHLLLHSLLGIALHRGVDRGVDPEAVAVDVIIRAVGLLILVAPAIERILVVLLNSLLVVPIGQELSACGTLGIHHLTQHLAEVGRLAIVVRDGFILERDRECRQRIAHLARDSSRSAHTVDHEVSARQSVLGVAHGRVARRGIHHADQHRRLLNVQLIGRLSEEGARCRLDTEGVRAVLHRIEVHRRDLLLGVVVLELEGRDPLLELRLNELHRAGRLAAIANGIAGE